MVIGARCNQIPVHRTVVVFAKRETVGGVVIVCFDQKNADCKSVADFAAPRDALGSGESLVDEIEGGEQQQGLVRSLVRRAFLKGRDADIEVVEAFDGGGEEHEGVKVEN